MQFDLTITVTAILGVSAIISPIATAIIDNLFRVKFKKLEMQQQALEKTTYHVRSIFENYFRYAGRCVYNSDLEALKDYGEYCFLALTYAPESFSSSFIEIDNAIRQRDFDAAVPLLEQLNLEIGKLLRNP